MSGGFFRGTSADQDTRFSNKQAKLMKSQKFPAELEHLVDMKKVKMDVMRPWIATRVTELLGFEDEVLINFIYGLLDTKEVNGKEVQIQLTGFMEKNTGKFMKELWTLLLSAQKNESGVPQQFLDAKEEETRKKQAEVDRITNEIQKKKENERKEFERERPRKMDGGAQLKANVDALEAASKHFPKGSSGYLEDEKEAGHRNGTRGRNRFSRSPRSTGHSNSPPRGSPSRGSSGKRKSRSLSRSPEALKRAVSPDRVFRSPSKRSGSPRRRYPSRGSRSPSRRISSFSRQRSRSPSARRSPSPVRRRLRSPIRRRSPSPIRRRSPSPFRRRRSLSPVGRRRSPYPVARHRSPRRSPSPVARRRSPSPVGRRRSPSPVGRRRSRSPIRHRRSPSPFRRRRSPSPFRRGRSPMLTRRRSPPAMRRRSPIQRHRSPSPVRSRYQRSPSSSLGESPPLRHRSPNPAQRRAPIASPPRSTSPYGSSSPSPVRSRVHSAVRRSSKEGRMSPAESPEQRVSMQEKSITAPQRPTNSLRSPQRDVKPVSPSPRRLPAHSESPPIARTRNSREDRRSNSPHESPVRQRSGRRNRSTSLSGSPVRRRQGRTTNDASLSPPLRSKEQQAYHRSPESSKEDQDSDYARDYKARSSQKRPIDSSTNTKQKDSLPKVQSKDEHSERVAGQQATNSRTHLDIAETRKGDQEIKIEKGHRKRAHPRTPERHISPVAHRDSLVADRQPISHTGGQKSDEKDRLRSNNNKDSDKRHKSEIMPIVVEKVDQSNGVDSGTEGSGKRRTDSKEKRKHKRSHRDEVVDSDNDESSDSEIEDKKDAKRRRKEEKKQKKEEKRRRREERRRKREERKKLKRKDPHGTSSSDDEHSGRKEYHASDGEDAHSEQKKLEIELRKKAIESLKAKKGISH
ncbi:Serine/arginine repetitive matrix protein 1 [Euphorbia peplus]|nr:Serine/arginine repetitive matrix protein 1 [Euphorbia peplus]